MYHNLSDISDMFKQTWILANVIHMNKTGKNLLTGKTGRSRHGLENNIKVNTLYVVLK